MRIVILSESASRRISPLLQVLRDMGLLTFLGSGSYRLP
jgi:hypothetical protein